MEANTTSRPNAGSRLAEGAVILVSILLAFWLEGWRENRVAEEELRQELVLVEIELKRNRELMAAHLTSLERIVGGSLALGSALESSANTATVEIPDTMVVLALNYSPSFDPSLGGVEALIASGRLAGIRDPELRLGLASLRDLMDDAREEELLAREVTVHRIDPVLGPQLDGSKAQHANRAFFGFLEPDEALEEELPSGSIAAQERTSTRPLRSFETVEFPNSLEIRNALGSRRGWLLAGRVEFRRLLAYLDSLIERLEQELEGYR